MAAKLRVLPLMVAGLVLLSSPSCAMASDTASELMRLGQLPTTGSGSATPTAGSSSPEGNTVLPPAGSPDAAAGDQSSSIPDSLGPFSPPPLPPEPAVNHAQNKTMDIGPVTSGPLIQIGTLRPIRLEASYNEPFTLRDALIYSIDHNLPIKISQETWNSQRHLFYAAMGGFLPNLSTNWNLTHTKIYPSTESNSRQFNTSVSQPVFQGGRVLYSALAQYYRAKGWHYSFRGTINDTLLDVYTKYTNLLLNRALLQIRIKSMETSEAQLHLNEQLYTAGTGTRFAVMQSRTQLALDRQALLLQQVAVRQAALALSFSLNMPLAINLVPQEQNVTESALVDENLEINELLNTSLVHRPELRQFEFFRLAANRNVQVQAAQYYPTVTLFTTYSHTSTSIYGSRNSGNANTSNQAANLTGQNTASGGSSFPSPPSTVNPQPPAGLNTTSNATSPTTAGTTTNTTTNTTNVNTGSAVATVPSGGAVTSGGVPQSGQLVGGASTGNATVGISQSGLASPGGASANPGSSSGSSSNIGTTIGAGVFGSRPTNSIAFGFQMNWSLPGLGVPTAYNILSAKALARQALLQANQELLLVSQQVRSAYLNALTARQQIDVAAAAVASSGEALRLANLRVQTGVGTNLELIQAQRDYITALVNQAQSIISSNQAQAQLLHDTGLISVETLTTGYRPRIGEAPGKKTF